MGMDVTEIMRAVFAEGGPASVEAVIRNLSARALSEGLADDFHALQDVAAEYGAGLEELLCRHVPEEALCRYAGGGEFVRRWMEEDILKIRDAQPADFVKRAGELAANFRRLFAKGERRLARQGEVVHGTEQNLGDIPLNDIQAAVIKDAPSESIARILALLFDENIGSCERRAAASGVVEFLEEIRDHPSRTIRESFPCSHRMRFTGIDSYLSQENSIFHFFSDLCSSLGDVTPIRNILVREGRISVFADRWQMECVAEDTDFVFDVSARDAALIEDIANTCLNQASFRDVRMIEGMPGPRHAFRP